MTLYFNTGDGQVAFIFSTMFESNTVNPLSCS